tara:strand:+ start:425 stop:1324 length:900 start_codon:yes stop_codon:yes gene_type:complete
MSSTDLKKAISILDAGGVVGIPTETVYGLAARINLSDAIDKIFTTKQRPSFDPLIVHVASIKQAANSTSFWPMHAEVLANTFWPGPLTLVLPKAESISSKITSGLDSVGLRCPNHEVTLELIRHCGPLAAPSANRFGKTSPTQKSHVDSEFNNEVYTIDGGPCQIGIESTVAGIFDDHIEIYRPGAITASMIKEVVDVEVVVKESPVSPGTLKHHYMPDVPMYLSLKDHPRELESLKYQTLVLNSDPAIAARELYQKMREAAATNGVEAILLKRLSNQSGELWDGIWNRVSKAITQELV